MIDLGDIETFVDGLDHPEGVAVGPDGTVFAGGENGQVYRIPPDGGDFEEVANTGGFLLGLALDGNGSIYACDLKQKAVFKVEPSSGDVSRYSDGTSDRKMVTPNWPVFDDAGNLYVTDSGDFHEGDGCIFKVLPGGSTEIWTDEVRSFPNGACLSEDGNSLLVVESAPPALVKVPIQHDGSAGPREVVTEIPQTVPDGVSVDTEGNAYVTCYRPDRIIAVAPDGTYETLADDPAGTVLAAPTNGAWAGEDRKSLLIANLGRWHLARVSFGPTGAELRYPNL